jgi:hypothetical protein
MNLGKIAVLFTLGSALCAAEQSDIISRPALPRGTDEVVRIDRPNPTQRQPNIHRSPSSRVIPSRFTRAAVCNPVESARLGINM